MSDSEHITTGSTVFCDDIRYELDGKVSFMGVYQSVMFVQEEFPFVLPKFGMTFTYSERIGTRSGPVIIRVFLPQLPAPAIETELRLEEIRKETPLPDPDTRAAI